MSKHKIIFENPSYAMKLISDEEKLTAFKTNSTAINGIYGIKVKSTVFRDNVNYQLEKIYSAFGKTPAWQIPANCSKFWVVVHVDISRQYNHKFRIYLSRLLLHPASLQFCEYQLLDRYRNYISDSKKVRSFINTYNKLNIHDQEQIILYGDIMSMFLGIRNHDRINIMHDKNFYNRTHFNKLDNVNIVELNVNEIDVDLLLASIYDNRHNYNCIYYLGMKLYPMYNYIKHRKVLSYPISFAELYFIRHAIPKLYYTYDAHPYSIPSYIIKYKGYKTRDYDYVTGREYRFSCMKKYSNIDKKIIRDLSYQWLLNRCKVNKKLFSIKIYEKLYTCFDFPSDIKIIELE
jgi:hypothetical protein